MSEAVISFPMLGNLKLDPQQYISLGGNLRIYWYGIIIACAFLFAVLYASKRAPEFGLVSDNVFDMIIWAVPAAIVFGRLYYVIFEWPMYRDNLSEIYKLWNGGIAMYGVMFGGLLGIYIYSRKKKIPFGTLMDLACIPLFLAQSMGRWGNFVNREAYGYETTLPWKMGLTVGGSTTYVHPTFLYESLWTLAGFLFLHFYSKKHRRYDGQLFGIYIFWYGLARLVIEGLRTDSLYFLGTGVRVSQVVGFVSSCCALVYLLYNRFRVVREPSGLYVNRPHEAAEAVPAPGEEPAEPYDVHKDKDFYGDEADQAEGSADSEPVEGGDGKGADESPFRPAGVREEHKDDQKENK